MTEALNRTGGSLSTEMTTYYEKVFLARAKQKLVYQEGAVKSTHGKTQGKSIVFNQRTPLTVISSALSEGANPSVVNATGSAVSCTLAEYGNTVKISKFLTLTGIDANNKESIEVMGQNMGESLDYLTGKALSVGATHIFANSKKVSSLASSDTIDAYDLRTAVQKIEVAKGMPYEDGFYMGKFVPQTKTSLLKDSVWLNAKTYSDTKDLYNGEMGEIYQVRCLMSTQALSSTGAKASYTDAYLNFVHGRDAFGVYDLEGDQPKLYILPNPVDSNNPTGRYALISWAGSFVAKVLNANWIYAIKAAPNS